MPRHMQVALVLLSVAICLMGLYALHLKRQAETLSQHPGDQRPITPPVAGPRQTVTLLVADDEEGSLHTRQLSVALPEEPGARAREILQALLAVYLEKNSSHPLASGADIREVFVLQGTAIIDVNAAFAEGHRSGILIEELTLASFSQTLAANVKGVTRVKILVEGRERETLAGHADLMDFYEVGAGADLASK